MNDIKLQMNETRIFFMIQIFQQDIKKMQGHSSDTPKSDEGTKKLQ